MRETDPHRRGFPHVLHGTQVNRVAAVAGAKFVEGGVQALMLFLGLMDFRFRIVFRDHRGEELGREIVLFDQVRERDGDLNEMRAMIGSFPPEFS